MPLYAAMASGATTSDLYTLDPTTAVATSIGPTGHAFTALAFDPTTGTLYGVTSPSSAANPKTLFTIDETTGDATLIGVIFSAVYGTPVISDIAFNSSGQLYGTSGSSPYIHVIDKTSGTYTRLSDGVSSISALAFDDSDVLYVVSGSGTTSLYTVDATTGVPTLLGPIVPSSSQNAAALSFDSDGLLWWISGAGVHRLNTLNVSTRAWAVVGTDAANPGDNFDALAWGVGSGDSGEFGPEFTKIKFGDGLSVIEEGDGVIRVDSGASVVTAGHVIQDEGTARAQRAALNFVGSGVTATDDSSNNRTLITIPGAVPPVAYSPKWTWFKLVTLDPYDFRMDFTGSGRVYRMRLFRIESAQTIENGGGVTIANYATFGSLGGDLRECGFTIVGAVVVTMAVRAQFPVQSGLRDMGMQYFGGYSTSVPYPQVDSNETHLFDMSIGTSLPAGVTPGPRGLIVSRTVVMNANYNTLLIRYCEDDLNSDRDASTLGSGIYLEVLFQRLDI